MSINGPFLYPQVGTARPEAVPVEADRSNVKESAHPTEFENVLSQVREPLKFSSHAMKRINDRGIQLDAVKMSRLNDAVDKALAKGVDETLLLTNDGAFIVSAKNRTVITAIDKSSIQGNVFTNIEGAIIV